MEKFFVNEIQNGTSTTYAFDSQNVAESKYHDILHYAAVSSVSIHGAILYDNYGNALKHECYTHEQATETAE